MLLQSWRMTRRDWRAGELRFLLIALIVAVAALSSVGFFVDRMRSALERDANQLLGADLLVAVDHAVPPEWIDQATSNQLSVANTIVFPSMAQTGEGDDSRSLLSSLKAVSAGYPLRGSVKLVNPAGGEDIAATSIPADGTVWVDTHILTGLSVHVGDNLSLGDKSFTIAGVIAVEPDRGGGFVNFAPRVMLPLADLEATGLLQNGSRATYRMLIAGNKSQVAAYQQWLQTQISQQNMKGVRIETLEEGRPEMRSTLDRAEQFLSLVSLLSAMLAAVAVAMAARRFMLRHLNACAMLRCLGMTQSQVTVLYLTEFLIIGVAGGVLGALGGFLAHFALIAWLGSFLPASLPAASLLPGLQGVATGLLLLLGFALPPILQLRNVPHNRVIRGEDAPPKASTLATYLLGTGIFVALLLWQAKDLTLGGLTALGFLGGFGAFALVTWGALKALRHVKGMFNHQSWRFAVNGLQRRPGSTIMQVVALSLGMMALLLLTVIRGDLVNAWMQATPADAPNRFVINIQPEQQEAITSRLIQAGVAEPLLYPMIRGRLVQLNGQYVNGDSYTDDRAKRMVDREFNLSTATNLPVGNEIVAGRWYDNTKPEASVEEGLAKTLNLKVGDTMQFDIAGELVDVPITSLRKLEWGSMQANFFVVINPAAMQDMPQTWITAFHLPDNQTQFDHALIRDYPNLTVVDISSILKQVQDVVGQVIAAVEFLFLFTLASGVLVLYAALVGSQQERIREAGLLRALGATRQELARAQWIEFALTGSLAGILAASGAAAIGWALAHFVFKFSWAFSVWVWLAGAVIGALCALIGGTLGLRQVLQRPPLQTLREA
jgi:putative ABC transport system permease protein